jgi:hypothetical protein
MNWFVTEALIDISLELKLYASLIYNYFIILTYMYNYNQSD